jgi:hypothetical protein
MMMVAMVDLGFLAAALKGQIVAFDGPEVPGEVFCGFV